MTSAITSNSVNSNNPSFFSTFSSAAASNLMTLQLGAGQIEPSGGLFTATNPLVPDRLISSRLGNFDPDLYDLRDQSTLMKVLKVLLGGAGAGGLRKQSVVARLQNAFSGMHFLDLDRFYGALFGIQRTGEELTPNFSFDPYHDATTPDQWNQIHSQDSSYRGRLIRFAKSIYYGGSAMGLRAMAEALVGAECDIFESWEWVDEENYNILINPVLIYTYTFLSNNIPQWSALSGHSWADWGGGTVPFVGRTGQKNRSEFIIQPKKNLTADEQYEIVRVMNTFKPAGSQFTVNPNGLVAQDSIILRTVAADSEYWEIVPTIIPNVQLQTNPYSPGTDITVPVVQPRPAFSAYQGEQWSYNNDILTVASYTQKNGVDGAANDDETIVYADGTSHVYTAAAAPMTGAQAISARIVSDGVLTSVPYAPTRSSINTALVGA